MKVECWRRIGCGSCGGDVMDKFEGKEKKDWR